MKVATLAFPKATENAAEKVRPKGWSEVELADLYEISSSKRVHQNQWTSSGVPFYRAREIVKLARHGHVDSDIFISEELYKEYSKYGIPQADDLMVSAVGTLGSCYIVQPEDRFYFKDASVLRFHPKTDVCAKFIKHAFETALIIDQINKGSGSTVGTFTIARASETRLFLPSLAEQKRIAAILDQADALRRLRQRAIAHLDTLDQAIFHEMFGEALQGRFFEFGNAVDEFRYGTSNKSGDTGLPTLRIPNVIGGGIDTSEIKTVEVTGAELKRLRLEDGDILFVRTNGNADYVGRCAAFSMANVASYDAESDWIFASYLIRARLSGRINPFFAKTYFASTIGRAAIRERSKTSAGQFNINTEGLASLPFPEVRRADQDRFAAIVAAVEYQSAPMKRAAAKMDEKFASLQFRAFRGEL